MTKSNFQLSTFLSFDYTKGNFQLLRVAIVDDHKMVAEGFERLINETGIAGVVGMAYSASGCLELLAKTEADILLLDVSLPDGNGIDLCRQIASLYPALKILMLTSHSELHIIKRALDGGAWGFILKNASTEVIVEGIRTVASGKKFLCEEVKKMLKERDPATIRLSRREQELLRLITDGKTTAEIADSMCLGVETIKSYRKNLMLKMNTGNVAEMVKMAIEQKLVFV